VQTADYSVFNYYIAPTYDFIQELRTQGSTLEVLEPKWLREQFAEEAKKIVSIYENDHFI
jgi:predicted DNA-binding transcriptional regulator YafY